MTTEARMAKELYEAHFLPSTRQFLRAYGDVAFYEKLYEKYRPHYTDVQIEHAFKIAWELIDADVAYNDHLDREKEAGLKQEIEDRQICLPF